MIVHHEAKERERQQKEGEKKEEEGENRSTVKVEEEHIDETEINKSKDRVYEHFKQVVSQAVSKEVEVLPKKKKKKKKTHNNQLILSQMAQQGKKRKRESDIKNEIQVKIDNNYFSTPTPSLDVRVMQSKKIKREEASEWKAQDNNSEIVQSIR